MPKFTLICDHGGDSLKTTLEFDQDTLPDVVANMDTFLRGCGFFFDGCLTIEEPEPEPYRQHSRHYYDFDRNR